jgi:glutamyl-tRNA synthetase
MTKICRFAPSPTGFLHVGNIRAAIINFLYAKKVGGKFMLRLDDTDTQRVKDQYREMILGDLAWLNLDYDIFVRQSDRLDRYREAKNQLINNGRLYECFETAEELNLQRKSQIASGQQSIYNRASLQLTQEQKNNLKNSGIKPHYRFLLEDKITSWEDKIKGRITYQGRHFSDPVLIRTENENNEEVPTYTFCSVVDDIDFNITDIIRGEDHITNTAIQIQIFEALGAKAPDFAHLALVKATNAKISKREGGFDVKSLREEGYQAMSLINLLAQIGTSEAVKINKDLSELIEDFSFDKFSKSATNYDISELDHINQKLIQKLNLSDVSDSLAEIGLVEVDEKFFNCIKQNISFIKEMKNWYEICKKEFRYSNKNEDKEFLSKISELLPIDTSKENSYQEWLELIKKNSDRKGKNLFMPIRLALTGIENGPELKDLINLIDRREILARLKN